MDWKESLQKRQEAVNRAWPIIETAERLYQEGMQEGVLELGRAEDLLLRAVAETYRLPLPEQQPGQEATMLELLQAVEKAGLLDKEELKSLHELRQCRNSLAHASQQSGSLDKETFDRAARALKWTFSYLLCGMARQQELWPHYRERWCMEEIQKILDMIDRAGEVAGKQAPEAAALRLGQALEKIVRYTAGIVCPWVLVGGEGEATLNGQINGLQQAGCYSEEEIRQLHAIQGLRNRAAHNPENPLDAQTVERAARWLKDFTLGSFARFLGVEKAYAEKKEEEEQDRRTEELLNTIRSGMEKQGQVVFGMMVVFSAAWLVLSLVLVWTSSINGTAGILQWVSMAGAVLCPVLWEPILLQAQRKAVRQGKNVQMQECCWTKSMIYTGLLAVCMLGGRYICVLHQNAKAPVLDGVLCTFCLLVVAVIILCALAVLYLHYFDEDVGWVWASTDMDRFGQTASFVLQVLLLVVFVVVMNRPPFTPYW